MGAKVPEAIKARLVAEALPEGKARIKEDLRLCQIFCSRGWINLDGTNKLHSIALQFI